MAACERSSAPLSPSQAVKLKGRTHDVSKIAALRHRQQNRQLGFKPTLTVTITWLITARRLLHASLRRCVCRCAPPPPPQLPRVVTRAVASTAVARRRLPGGRSRERARTRNSRSASVGELIVASRFVFLLCPAANRLAPAASTPSAHDVVLSLGLPSGQQVSSYPLLRRHFVLCRPSTISPSPLPPALPSLHCRLLDSQKNNQQQFLPLLWVPSSSSRSNPGGRLFTSPHSHSTPQNNGRRSTKKEEEEECS